MTETAAVKYEPNVPIKTPQTLSALLERPAFQESVMKIMAKSVNPQRLVKTVLVALSRQPKLLDCTQESFLKSFMIAAELGLDCSGTLGSSYLVPYRNKNGSMEAQFIIGYRGLIDLARRSGGIQSVSARVVYKQDRFKLVQGLEEILEHEPLDNERHDSDITGAYMIAHFKDGGHHIEYMSRAEIDSIRNRSRAKDSGPWVTDFSEMARKTVVRRGIKYLPLSVEVVQQIASVDDEIDFTSHPEPVRATLNIEDIKAGKPEDHTDAKDPIFPQNGSPVREPKGKKEPTIPDLFEDYVKSRGLRTRSGGKGVEYLYELVNEAFGVEKPADLDPSKVTPSQFQKWLVTDAESNLRAENYLPLERK